MWSQRPGWLCLPVQLQGRCGWCWPQWHWPAVPGSSAPKTGLKPISVAPPPSVPQARPAPCQPPSGPSCSTPSLHTFSLQTPEAWLKTTDRAHHSPFKNPAVASCCTWNKMQAPSVSAQQALPNSNFVLIPGHRLSHTGLISVP